MAFEAQYVQGPIQTMDYTPTSGDVPAGQVVVLSATDANGPQTGVAHLAIADDTLGTLAIDGGVYLCPLTGAAAAFAPAYWDDTNNTLTATATGNAKFGYFLQAGNGVPVLAFHQPYGA